MKSITYFLASTYCVICLYTDSCYKRLEVIKDLIWTICGSFLNIVHLKVFFSSTSWRCNPANFLRGFQNCIFQKVKKIVKVKHHVLFAFTAREAG